MSKRKEIEVWVRAKEEDLLNSPAFGFKVYSSNPHIGERTFKAKLVFDLPEKEIKLTESQFDDALKEAREHYRDTSDCIYHLRQALFGKEQV